MADLTVPTFDQTKDYTTKENLVILCDMGPADYVGPNTARAWDAGFILDEEYAKRLNASEWRATMEHQIFIFLGTDRRDYLSKGKFWKTMRYGAAYTPKGIPLTDAAFIARVRKLIA